MDVSDFFKDIKDRLASPIISSFIISWVFINYRITVPLVFYKQEQVALDGYTSYVDLIYKNTNVVDNFVLPFLFACLYVFGFSVLRNYIQMFLAYTKRWGNEKTLKISRTGVIPVERFLSLKEKYLTLITGFTKAVENENDIAVKNEELKIEIENYTASLAKLNKLQETNHFRNSKSSLVGKWKVSISDDGRTATDTQNFDAVITESQIILDDKSNKRFRYEIISIFSRQKETLIVAKKIQEGFNIQLELNYWHTKYQNDNLFSGFTGPGKSMRLSRKREDGE